MSAPGAMRVFARTTLAAVCAGFLCVPALGQRTLDLKQPSESARPSPADIAINQPYLTPAERRELKVFFGRWDAATLDGHDDLRDQAAAYAGLPVDPEPVNDPSLVSYVWLAEQALSRGDLESALTYGSAAVSGEDARTANDSSPNASPELIARSVLVLAQAHAASGRELDALDVIEAATDSGLVLGALPDDAPTALVTKAELLILRAELTGEGGAATYQRALDLLTEARTRDPLYWPAYAVEAKLLIDRHSRADGAQALEEGLRLNPRSGEMLALAGQLGVDGLAPEQAFAQADRLDEIARELTGDPGTSHPLGDLVRVKMHIRLDEPEEAERFAASALRHMPRSPEALAWHAGAAALRYDWDEVERRLNTYDELVGKSPLALTVVGEVLSGERQYEEAAAYLARAIERRPGWARPWLELGLLEMQSGRDARAYEALTRATELDPFNVRARNSLTLISELLSYDTIETEHFRIRYKPGVDAALARDMAAHLEDVHTRIGGAFGFTPKRKTTLELMPDHQWFAVRITGMKAIHTIAACTGPVIAMEAPRIGAKHTGEYDWLNVFQHEYVHTATLAITRNRIPLWFTEAAAVYHQFDQRSWDTWQQLATALERDELFGPSEISLAFSRPKRPGDRSLAYAQSHWMYQFIIDRFGADAPLRLIERFDRGQREREAIPQALGLSQEQFFTDFKDWARDDLLAHGVIGAPSLSDLALDALATDPAYDDEAYEALARLGRTTATAIAGRDTRASDLALRPPRPKEDSRERWLDQHPEHPELLRMRVARELQTTGGEATESLVPLLERYAKATPVDPLPHRLLAQHYREAGEPALAVPHLEFLDSRSVYSWAYAAELARQYARVGEHTLAQDKAERAVLIAPYRASHRELAAAAAINTGDLDAAERHIRALTLLEPGVEVHQRRLERLDALRRSPSR